MAERRGDTKPFALTHDDFDGASRVEAYDKYPNYQQAKELHNWCMLYAAAYNETMLKRMEKEKPEFFEENNISKREMMAHLTNNMCLPYTKYKGRIFRETTAALKDSQHLNEQIRRLNNGGDRFHPYL